MWSFGTARLRIAAVAVMVALAAPVQAQTPPAALADPGPSLSLPPVVDAPATLVPHAPPPLAVTPNQPLAPISPAARTKTVLSLSALHAEHGPAVTTGLHWRIFADRADANGNYPLVYETAEPAPLTTLDPGGYVVSVTYGLVSETRHLMLGLSSDSVKFVLDSGALRLNGTSGGAPITTADLTFDIHRTDGGIEIPVATGLKPGQIVRIPAGAYQVTSTYGTANARIVSEVRVQPGKLTDATVHHRAGRVQLRLAADPAGAADAAWSVLTTGGDTITDTSGSAPELVLAEGDYVAVARRGDRTYQKTFTVKAGTAETVTVSLDQPVGR
jgi:hypothetical protein